MLPGSNIAPRNHTQNQKNNNCPTIAILTEMQCPPIYGALIKTLKNPRLFLKIPKFFNRAIKNPVLVTALIL
jgi:hypothetical protein